MVMLCVSGPVTTFTPPAGYGQLGSIGATSTGEYCGLFYHVWSTGDPMVVSFADNFATPTERDYITATYSGENTVTPFDPSKTPGGPGTLSGTSLTLPALSPSGSNDLLASFWAEANMSSGSPTVTYSSPLTPMMSYQLPTSWNKNFVANGALSASGSTGNKAATFSMAPTSGVGFIVALQPATTGSTPTPTASTTATTPTVTPTATSVGPTATATATIVPPTATATAPGATPTRTATAAPSVTVTATPTATASPAPGTVCQVVPDNAGTGFKWSCPQADSVCKVNVEDGVSIGGGNAVMSTKYGCSSGYGCPAWASAWGSATGRLANMGVNTAGQYSYSYISNWAPGEKLYVPTEAFSFYAQQDSKPYHVKDAQYVVNPAGMKCTSWGYYQSETPDSFDPAAPGAFNALAADVDSIYKNSNPAAVRFYVPDDGDSLFIYDGIVNHPDGGFVIAANSPVQHTSAPAVGGAYTFPNSTYWAKIGLADYMAGKYGCVGSGVSITSATQNGYIVTAQAANSFTAGEMVVISGMTPAGYNNSGYPVLVMPQGLSSSQFEYALPTFGLAAGSGGAVSPVGSALVTSGTDPIGITSCASTKIASALSALNTAWGTSYTTFGTTDAKGLAGIAANTYTATTWSNGTSTGLLDENGSNIMSSSALAACGGNLPHYGAAWGRTPAVNSDINQFIGIFAGLHFEQLYVAYHAVCGSNCPPLSNLLYDGQTEAYQQASPYVDVMTVHPFYYPTLAAATAELQKIINNDAGKPVIVENYSATTPISGCVDSFECASTQSARGAGDAAQYATMDALTNSQGKHAVIGNEHWMLYDWNNNSSNGMVTANDNYYDGSQASTASTSPTWSANHTYKTPQIVSDGTNKESLMLTGEAGQTCISGVSAPTWATTVGAFTTDGTCTWNNVGPFNLTPEAGNYGDYVEPVATFFKAMNQNEQCDAPPTGIIAPSPVGASAATVAANAETAAAATKAATATSASSGKVVSGAAGSSSQSTATLTPTITSKAGAAVWNLEPTASGFKWISPGGAAMCKFTGVSMVDSSNLTRAGQYVNVVPDKYATWPAWAQAQSDRLKSWGFNAAGQYSYKYYANAPKGGVPSEVTVQVSGHAARDDGSYYHCKSVNHDYGAMECGSGFDLPSGGGSADVFDVSCDSGRGYAGAVMADLGAGGSSNIYCPNCGLPAVSTVELVTTEDAETLYGINNQYIHEDFGYVLAAHNPMMTASPSGYTYPNATLDAKIALRDWLASKYGCTKSGGGGGTPISGGDDIYSSTANCGSTNAANALSALNSAWGTSYTTWGTSDTGGEAGIKNGAYNSYGTGTGFLDESGSHILTSRYKTDCNLNGGIRPGNSWAVEPDIETDLHNFVAYFAETYAKKLSAAWAQPSANPHPPIFLPLYDGPDYVYKALAPYFDGFWVNPTAGSSTGEMSLTDLQRIIADASVTDGKSMPIVIADYSNANPDSPWSAKPALYEIGPQSNTQGARGNAMVSWWQNAIHLQDANSRYVVMGLEHWGFYDDVDAASNLGLVTSDHDSPYDGSADIANGEAQNYGDVITPLSNFLNSGICDP